MPAPPVLPNTLIIEGHGETYDPRSAVNANYFQFSRSAATKCTLYSYVREGALMDAQESNRSAAKADVTWPAMSVSSMLPADPAGVVALLPVVHGRGNRQRLHTLAV